ncbi:MAG: flagellar biosynthetic protein FliR [Bdellovibrionales bacterium]|nr:flagellar biosynthetic protein FliR [Bdellovibrionales bacterium]
MANIYNFNEIEMLSFILVFIRMTSFIVSWPVFGSGLVPTPAKVLFSLVITLVIFPVLDRSLVSITFDSYQMVFLAMKEVFIGVTFGFLARMFFFCISVAGQLNSITMGISSSQLFNPAMGSSASSLEQFKVAIATLFFLAIQGHHVFLQGIVMSFDLVPMGLQGVNFLSSSSVGEFTQQVMEIGVRLSAPVLVAVFFMNISMAVIGRAVPQINVLITSLPVNILAGFVIMIIVMPIFIWQMEDIVDFSAEAVFKLLKTY